ncbi:MAG TPA: glycosyltransferase [Casimicrobiaceae bacterium]|jgi:glycosyltransferase involved in cell wall biosynthesis|nr:glycosyltransferase [Casimicrobiaceae bacterium]
MKRVLMVAFHFPPLRGSSGIQRTLRFAKYLPEFGWEPIVLTASPRAYDDVGDDLLADIPQGMQVTRAFALDTARHLALAGRYPAFLARPDRWKTWWLGAVPAGLRLIRRFAPQALWSTYPVATAHAIGCTLQRRSALPWIADFRDPMAQDGYPPDPRTWRAYQRIEQRVAANARRLVFTTPGAERLYRDRYRDVPGDRFALIENGYDEEVFAAIDADARTPLVPGQLTLLHSGIVYPEERDPTALMAALGTLRAEHPQVAARLRIRFRAPVHETMLRAMATARGVGEMIDIAPALPYQAALAEMLRADGLLILQAANCNEQIPAKLYEYLRARRPIVALTDPAGDTALTLRRVGGAHVAALDAAAAIAELLRRFVTEPEWREELPDAAAVAQCSRRARTAALAGLLDASAAVAGESVADATTAGIIAPGDGAPGVRR